MFLLIFECKPPFLVSYCFRKETTFHTEQDRLQLWQKYVRLQLYVELCSIWGKVMIVPTMISATTTIIICFYVTIRPENVPLWLVLVIFYVGITLFGIVFWTCYQVILVIRGSEEIIRALTSLETGDWINGGRMGLPPLQLKKYILIRGKATRPLNYRIGEFNDFTLDVPIGIWDEILNQLFFLLTY